MTAVIAAGQAVVQAHQLSASWWWVGSPFWSFPFGSISWKTALAIEEGEAVSESQDFRFPWAEGPWALDDLVVGPGAVKLYPSIDQDRWRVRDGNIDWHLKEPKP